MTISNRSSTAFLPQRSSSQTQTYTHTQDKDKERHHRPRDRERSRSRSRERQGNDRDSSLDRCAATTSLSANANANAQVNPFSSFGISPALPGPPAALTLASTATPALGPGTSPISAQAPCTTSPAPTPTPTPTPLATPRHRADRSQLKSANPIHGSPSQIDPFGSQVTSPEPIHRPSHGHHSRSNTRSRPPSTVLSNGSVTPLTLNGSVVVTPKIILASPSTSTIHYLFPSSDTRSAVGAAGLLGTSTISIGGVGSEEVVENTNKTAGAGVQRAKSTSSNRANNRTSFPQAKDGRDRDRDRDRDRSAHSAQKLNQTTTTTPTHVRAHAHVPTQKHKKATSLSQTPAATPLGPTRRLATANSGATPGGLASGGGVKKSQISAPILTDSDEMVGLRRQPGMIDLSLSGRSENRATEKEKDKEKGVKRRESVILKEIENRRERRGWEIGSRPHHAIEAIDPPSPKTKTAASHQTSQIRGPLPYPYVPATSATSISLSQRRRSQSLSSPRPAPSPPIQQGRNSPFLPAPDFGDPLTLSTVIDSPSYSHLDYSTAGASATGASGAKARRGSNAWCKVGVIFPHSVAMSRGDTRKGLGGYEAGKFKALEDAEKRLNGNHNGLVGGVGRFSSIRRTVSLKKKGGEEEKRTRPRSQSLTSRSARNLGLAAPPLPLASSSDRRDREKQYKQDKAQRPLSFIGDLSINLGDRYAPFSPSKTPSDLTSPLSIDTSVFPHSTPSSNSGYGTLPSALSAAAAATRHHKDAHTIHLYGRPLHPALALHMNTSEISILAPSTVGLGFSPVGTPVSLPESLEAEAVDLTERGNKLSTDVHVKLLTDPLPGPGRQHLPSPTQPTVPSPEISTKSVNGSAKSEKRVPRRSLLLAQNTFYLPPQHQKPAAGVVGKKPSLRSSKSLGPGFMKRAYTPAILRSDAQPQTTAPGAGAGAVGGQHSVDEGRTESGRGLLKSASIRSAQPSSHYDTRRQTTIGQGSGSGSGNGSGRLSATPSMRFRRPLTAFSLCSPPDAIDPLPLYTSPDPSDTNTTTNAQNRYSRSESRTSRTLRSGRSSPFLSASASLRVMFGKEGFVARSLSQAFDSREREAKRAGDKEKDYRSSPGSGSRGGLKAKISSPLEASRETFRTQSDGVRKSAHMEVNDRAWRESLLRNAVSRSIKEGLNCLAGGEETTPTATSTAGPTCVPGSSAAQEVQVGQRMVSSGSKSRLAIPDQLLSAPLISEPEPRGNAAARDRYRVSTTYTGIGEAMLRSSTIGESMQSGLDLQAIVDFDGQDRNTGAGEGVGRGLGQVGKDESMASASVYSNNASTFCERKPPSRLLGKGFPSSLSTSTTATAATTGTTGTALLAPSHVPLPTAASLNNMHMAPSTKAVPAPAKGTEKSSKIRSKNPLGGRIISQPMPLVHPPPAHLAPMPLATGTGSGSGKAEDDVVQSLTQPLSLALRSTRPTASATATATAVATTGPPCSPSHVRPPNREPSPLPSPSESYAGTLPEPPKRGVEGKTSPSRSKPLNLRAFSSTSPKSAPAPAPVSVSEQIRPVSGVVRVPSPFSTLRTSIRSYSRSVSAKSTLSTPGQSNRIGTSTNPPNTISHQHQNQRHYQPISSSDAQPARAILEQLVKRDEEEAFAQAQRGLAAPAAQAQAQGEKMKKVLEWRSEVDENGRLARLEERMRGFVQGEKERMRGIESQHLGLGVGASPASASTPAWEE